MILTSAAIAFPLLSLNFFACFSSFFASACFLFLPLESGLYKLTLICLFCILESFNSNARVTESSSTKLIYPIPRLNPDLRSLTILTESILPQDVKCA